MIATKTKRTKRTQIPRRRELLLFRKTPPHINPWSLPRNPAFLLDASVNGSSSPLGLSLADNAVSAFNHSAILLDWDAIADSRGRTAVPMLYKQRWRNETNSGERGPLQLYTHGCGSGRAPKRWLNVVCVTVAGYQMHRSFSEDAPTSWRNGRSYHVPGRCPR